MKVRWAEALVFAVFTVVLAAPFVMAGGGGGQNSAEQAAAIQSFTASLRARVAQFGS